MYEFSINLQARSLPVRIYFASGSDTCMHDYQAIFAQHDVYQNKIEFLVVYHWLSQMLDYVNGNRNIL